MSDELRRKNLRLGRVDRETRDSVRQTFGDQRARPGICLGDGIKI